MELSLTGRKSICFLWRVVSFIAEGIPWRGGQTILVGPISLFASQVSIAIGMRSSWLGQVLQLGPSLLLLH